MNAQYSLTDQLRELVKLANKNGLYDAADWLNTQIQTVLNETESRTESETSSS